MRRGFEDGLYAAVPYGNSCLVILYNGEQLETVKTVKQARDYIANHKTGTTLFPSEEKSPIIRKRAPKKNDAGTQKVSTRTTRKNVGPRTPTTKDSSSTTKTKSSIRKNPK
jgi:hypothetical protein